MNQIFKMPDFFKNWGLRRNSISRKLSCKDSIVSQCRMWAVESDLALKPSSATFYLCDHEQVAYPQFLLIPASNTFLLGLLRGLIEIMHVRF